MKHRSPANIILSILLLGCVAVAIWWMSANVVWLGDDLDYKYVMRGRIWQSWGWIGSWNEFWQSQFTHYMNVNGRFAAHTLVQLFNGIFGQQAFAICNAVIYAIFAFTIARIGKAGLYNFSGLFSAVCLSVVCFITKMMPTCQIGYIWGMLVNLLWLAAFFNGGRPFWGKVVFTLLFGIIAGNWQESISIGVCAGLGIWWLAQFFNRHKTIHTFFDWRRSWIMLGYFIGTASNCLSPATLSRVQTVTTPVADQLIVASYSLPGVAILLLTLIILAFLRKSRLTFSFSSDNGKIPDGLLIIAMLGLLVFNGIIGVYSNRQLFGANLFAIILTLRALPRHTLGGWLNLAAFLAVLAVWALNLTGIEEVRRQYNDIATLHAQSKDGVVEYDRTRVMTLGHPLNAKYYEDILGQFDNDLHHSLMKDFKHNSKGKTLKLRPATKPDAEKVEQYAPGHFYVTVREPEKGKPAREVILHGHYSILGIIKIPAAPQKLDLLKFSRRQAPFATAVVIPEIPLYAADSISITLPISSDE